MRDWPRTLMRALQSEPAVVRAMLCTVRGSSPREAGAGMLVGRERIEGTIGGGQLEWQALGLAREMLAAGQPRVRLQRLVLATDVGQCCGGAVDIWFERFETSQLPLLQSAAQAADRGAAVLISMQTGQNVEHRLVSECGVDATADALLQAPWTMTRPQLQAQSGQLRLLERLDEPLPPVWLYGAGHVGQALARILGELPLRLTWIDSRAELLAGAAADTIHILHSSDPPQTLTVAAPMTRFLVLTHSHALDYALCRAILQRGDFASLGLIGSSSKAARFRSRLARDGIGVPASHGWSAPSALTV